jgi:uncharacterized coiled-coil protein SlyX
MARKNVFSLMESDVSPAVENEAPFANSRPLAGFEKPLKRASPVGAISQSLGGVHEKAQRVDALEKQLAQGQAIVELDTTLVDSSFVVDRLGVSSEDQELLVSQIREHGQQVPILVRPHPERGGRFQVAYGHRRLAAIKKIGGPNRRLNRKRKRPPNVRRRGSPSLSLATRESHFHESQSRVFGIVLVSGFLLPLKGEENAGWKCDDALWAAADDACHGKIS